MEWAIDIGGKFMQSCCWTERTRSKNQACKPSGGGHESSRCSCGTASGARGRSRSGNYSPGHIERRSFLLDADEPRPHDSEEDFAPGFNIRLQHKDVALLKEWISELGGDFPAASLVYSLFTKALEMGLKDQGNRGVINIWER